MFDNIFQMLWEFFLTLVWFGKEWTQDKLRKAGTFLFHKNHTFLASDVWINEDTAHCKRCGKSLMEVRIKMDSYRISHWHGSIIILALALVSLSRADNFVGSPHDTTFFTDSTYIVKIALTQSNCAEATPCSMEVASPGGAGARFYNIYGDVDDTLAVLYNFPHGQFAPGTSWANLYFYGADGKAKDIWTIRLKYRETTSSLGLRRRAAGFRAPGLKWEGTIAGRKFK